MLDDLTGVDDPSKTTMKALRIGINQLRRPVVRDVKIRLDQNSYSMR